MSPIGPRSERPAFCEEFEKRIHGWHYRTMVTPGLSGLAQVTGGYDLLPKKKVVLDPWGVHHDIARRLVGGPKPIYVSDGRLRSSSDLDSPKAETFREKVPGGKGNH